MNSDMI